MGYAKGFRTIQNTRFVQQFATLGAGSSVFTIPPNNGIQDIVLNLEMPSNTDVAPATLYGLALPAGWGYGLIRQVSYRYGGSSQYFLSGQQLLQLALRKCPNASSRDDLFNLGGTAAAAGSAAAGDFAVRQRAYVWLPLPHTIPTSQNKLPPFPTDLLTQQCQITVELNPISSVMSAAAGASGTIPATLASAEFQVQQVIFEDQGSALARRVDMTSHALSYPVEFTQQEVVIPLANAVGQSVTLTGLTVLVF